jgi:hypothetical protein
MEVNLPIYMLGNEIVSVCVDIVFEFYISALNRFCWMKEFMQISNYFIMDAKAQKSFRKGAT